MTNAAPYSEIVPETPSIEALRELAHPGPVRLSQARPFVTVTFAQTLDGRIATRDGDSHWVSCQESLLFAHCLRATHDAVLVGIGTVLRDNPRLTTRLVEGSSPTRVIVDSHLRLPANAAVLRSDVARTLVVTTEQAPAERVATMWAAGVDVVIVRGGPDGRVDLADALARLAVSGVRSVMVEGGAQIITSVLRSGLADRLAVCIAPKILGSGLDAVGDLGISRLVDALRCRNLRVFRLGDDLLILGDLAPSSQPTG